MPVLPPDSSAHPVSYSRLWCLAAGIDALYLSGAATVPPGVVQELEEMRDEATETGAAVAVGDGWAVTGHSFGKYRFCLTHERGRLGVTPSDQLPALRFQPLAETLHGLGPAETVAWIDGVMSALVGPVRWSVSRVDLFSDWQGWTLTGDDRNRFLCRATARTLHEESEDFTGFEFGTRQSKTFSARIYDKTLQARRKGKDWWPEVWGEAYDVSLPVHRVEFEVNREAIRQFGLDSPLEVLDGAPSIWSYATDEWLTYRTPTGDQTKSRWPLAPEWSDVQAAPMSGTAIGLDRTLDGQRRGELRLLMPTLNGSVASYAALKGTHSIDDACAALPADLRTYERQTGRTFDDRVQDKLEQLRRAG